MTEVSQSELENPCGDTGPVQRWAVVWFLSVIVLGTIGVCKLSKVDRWMYDYNAEVLNYDKYEENRRAFTNVPMGDNDPRAFGGLAVARSELKSETPGQ